MTWENRPVIALSESNREQDAIVIQNDSVSLVNYSMGMVKVK
jgi:hypothetical protein